MAGLAEYAVVQGDPPARHGTYRQPPRHERGRRVVFLVAAAGHEVGQLAGSGPPTPVDLPATSRAQPYRSVADISDPRIVDDQKDVVEIRSRVPIGPEGESRDQRDPVSERGQQ